MDSAETSGRCLCPNGNAAVSLASEQQKRSHNILRRQHFGFYDGSNPQDCINSCRKSFFSLLLDAATSENDSTDTTPPQVCSLLSSPGVGDILWQLYWCDSAFCGVWIEAGTSGQDRECYRQSCCSPLLFPLLRADRVDNDSQRRSRHKPVPEVRKNNSNGIARFFHSVNTC